MSDNKPPKFIIVLGTNYSGSGAVLDYLVGRGDLHNPLEKEEYLLPILPNGLMGLEAVTGKAFHSAICEYHLIKFQQISEKLSHFYSSGPKKKELKKFSKIFLKNVYQLIQEISCADYPMRITWRELLKTPFEKNLSRVKNLIGLKQTMPKTRLLVSQKKFLEAVKKMHDNLFQVYANNKPTILNQAGSGWNPIESTKYFNNHKTILITRDPRDQYLEIKHFKKGSSVIGFIDWYKEMQSRLKLINDENTLQIKFEDFVNNNKEYINIICDFLELSSSVKSSYNVELSKKNVYKFHRHKDREIQLIENHLKDYIKN
tara:strand:- start:1580 stop:2527 length:948 start_codon:yes stop_codon:yes gene_type:complete